MKRARDNYRALLDSLEALEPLLPPGSHRWTVAAGLGVTGAIVALDRATGSGASWVVAYAAIAIGAGLLLARRPGWMLGGAAAVGMLAADAAPVLAWPSLHGLGEAVLIVILYMLSAFARQLVADVRSAARSLRLYQVRAARYGMADVITGLPNERALNHLTSRVLAAAARRAETLWMARIDVRGLRAFNRRRGWSAGDALLRDIARGVQAVVRPEDVVARVAADDLAVMFTADEPDGAQAQADRIAAAAQAIARQHGASVAVGFAGGRPAAWTAEDLLLASTRASDRSKGLGRGPAPCFVDMNLAS